jgi:predicted ATPase/DNA-binding CsgD family transcriptional regulator
LLVGAAVVWNLTLREAQNLLVRVGTIRVRGQFVGAFASPMFGRAAEREHLLGLLANPAVRLVTLTGRGGVGKTRLAADVVGTLASDDGAAVAVVPLVSVADPELVVPEIAAVLELPLAPGIDVADALDRELGTQGLLLVLDNFEHLLPAARPLTDLLDRCRGVRALVTSQSPLRLKLERVVELRPLAIPPLDIVDAARLRDEPAVAVYCERASAVDGTFVLSDGNAGAVSELCARLEGLPLALELVAARAATHPAAEIVARLETAGLDLVRRATPDASPRHHDLRAAIDWTYQLLAVGEQDVLRALSVLPSSFDIDAVEAVGGLEAGDALDALSTLVDLHLVDPVPNSEPARFVLPSSIRTFADERLLASGERDIVRRRHVAWQAARASELSAQSSGERPRSFERPVLGQEEMFAALVDAVDLGLVGEGLDLVVGLAPIFASRGYHAAHERIVEDALETATARGLRTPTYGNALLWSALLGLRNSTGARHSELIDRLRTGEQLARDIAADDVLLRALAFWLRALPFTGDEKAATRAINEGLELATRVGNDAWLAQFEVWAGMVAHQTGDDERAVALGLEGLRRARATGGRRTIVQATMLLHPLRPAFPDLVEDMPSLVEALEHSRATGLSLLEASLLPMLVIEAIDRDDEQTATRWCIESLVFARTMLGMPNIAYSLIAAAALAEHRDDHETAAYFHGMVRDQLPSLEPNMPPESVARHASVVEQARAGLPDHSFEAAMARGARVGLDEGIEAALRDLRRRATPTPDVETSNAAAVEPTPPPLTGRQIEVLQLLASGLTNKQIATRLHVSPKTVMHHALAIYRVLGVRSRSEATAWAFRTGLTQ